jgi:tRNA(Ile)-lysidine synthase
VVEEVKGDLRGFTFQHTEILMQFCRSHTSSGQIHLPGALIVEKNYGWLTVSVTQEDPVDFFYEIPGPGVHPLHLLDHSMEVQFLDLEGPPQFSDDPTDAIMDRDRISFPLFLRSSKSGDRFRPLGLDGSKKLKDFFIDLKVPRSHRRRIPVLCSKDHIVWLVGFRLDDRVKITTDTSRIARFCFRKGIEGE